MSAQTDGDDRRFADKARLSPGRRSLHVDDAKITAAIERQMRALGRRLAVDDPDAALLLRRLDTELTLAWAHAVAGWRASGFTDGDIARVLGVTKQAVAQRWPRAADHSAIVRGDPS